MELSPAQGDCKLIRFQGRGRRLPAAGCAGFMATLAALVLPAVMATPVKTAHTRAELLAEAPSIEPGQPFTIGLQLTPDPGWGSIRAMRANRPSSTGTRRRGWSLANSSFRRRALCRS